MASRRARALPTLVGRKRRSPIVIAYVLSLAVTIALLVVWVVYVVRSVARVRAIAGRIGVENVNTHWIVLTTGCALFSCSSAASPGSSRRPWPRGAMRSSRRSSSPP